MLSLENRIDRLSKDKKISEWKDCVGKILSSDKEIKVTIAGSQGMLLRHNIDERRAELEEELRISQQAEWWAQMGQQLGAVVGDAGSGGGQGTEIGDTHSVSEQSSVTGVTR